MTFQHAKWLAGVLLLSAGAMSSASWAAYPERPVRLIVAYPAGASTNDILGRVMADHLSRKLGENVVVENRPGAGGTIGTTLGAQAEPDGHTLLLGANGPMSISPHVIKLEYDPLKDFDPITLFAVVPYVVVTNPELPSAPEAGVPKLEVASWNGILAPKGTPKKIVEKLHRDIVETQEMRDFLVKQGVQVMTLGPAQFRQFMKAELDKWGKVIRDAGVKVK